jgi:hypothetical protein
MLAKIFICHHEDKHNTYLSAHLSREEAEAEARFYVEVEAAKVGIPIADLPADVWEAWDDVSGGDGYLEIDEGEIDLGDAYVTAARHGERVAELLEANNRYLERARAAERTLAAVVGLLESEIDEACRGIENMEAIHDKNGDFEAATIAECCEDRRKILVGILEAARSHEAPAAAPGLALDAARWRALFAGDRIRVMGWAGFDGDKPKPEGCHMGIELWDRHPSADPSSPYHGNNGTEREFAAKLLTAYADTVIAAKIEPKAEGVVNGD